MKITIKTLQQKLFTVDVEPEDTVKEIKSKITAEHGHPVESQKLIYSGKVLDDSKVVKDCNFKEKDFLVLMVSKAKATPAASTSAAGTSAAATTSAAPSTPAPAEAARADPNPTIATNTTNPNPGSSETTTTAPVIQPTASSDPSFVTGSALETTVQGMMEMGFPRDQCIRALRASFNNPDRAVEYLFNGIPEGLLAETAPRGPAAGNAPAATAGSPAITGPSTTTPATAPAAAQPATGGTQNLFQMAQQQHQQRGTAGGGGAAAALGGGGLGALGGAGGLGGLGGAGAGAGGGPTPESLAQVRQAVAQNPALLQQAIQAIVAENPALAAQLNQNPELLYQMFAGGDDDDDDGYAPGMGGMQPQTIALTPEEMEAIQRLQALGFTREQAAEAYLACGKNEELAANFLFEGGFQD